MGLQNTFGGLRIVAVVSSCMLAIAAQVVGAQTAGARKSMMKPFSATVESPTGSCPSDCEMFVTVAEDGTGNCNADIDGYLKIPGTSAGSKKQPKIVWTLKPTNPMTGASYEFHDVAGIVIISDPYDQLKSNKGGLGDGSGGGSSANPQQFHWKKHNNDHKTTLNDHPLRYFPIVMRKLADEYTLCTSSDPIMINDGG